MNEIKTDLFPEALRAGRRKGEKRKEGVQKNVLVSVEPLPESVRARKDGPGGE